MRAKLVPQIHKYLKSRNTNELYTIIDTLTSYTDMKNSENEKILIVEDNQLNAKLLSSLFSLQNYHPLVASNGEEALKIAYSKQPDLILLDIRLSAQMDGYQVCRQLKEHPGTKHIPVILITSCHDDASDIVKGFEVGSVDYITRPCPNEVIFARVKNHLRIGWLTRELTRKTKDLETQAEKLTVANHHYRMEIEKREQAEKERKQFEEERDLARGAMQMLTSSEAKLWKIENFISRSTAISHILDEVRNLQGTQTSVLISGESGTGKELIARAIHFGGRRKEKPFIAVNCSAIPKDLADSLFFGHVRGAFTGAHKHQRGYFELASGGSLFLDEIGDMPFPLQAKLLRVLEERVVTPLGDTRGKSVDVRVLSATNANLQLKIKAGTFREDFYYRIASFPVHVPSLRQRPGDIPLLSQHFLDLFGKEMGREGVRLSAEALATLSSYSFPGNIRELKNIIEYALIKSKSPIIKATHLILRTGNYSSDPTDGQPTLAPPRNYQELLNVVEKEKKELAAPIIRRALTYWLTTYNGNVTQVAKHVGVTHGRLYQLAREHDCDLSVIRKFVSKL